MQYDRTSDSPPEEDHDLMLVCFVTWRNLLASGVMLVLGF